MQIIILPKDKAMEVCYALPAPEIYKVPSVLAIVHPNGSDIVVIKSRFSDAETLAFTKSDFQWYDSPFTKDLDYSIFEKKNVLLLGGCIPRRLNLALLEALGE